MFYAYTNNNNKEDFDNFSSLIEKNLKVIKTPVLIGQRGSNEGLFSQPLFIIYAGFEFAWLT